MKLIMKYLKPFTVMVTVALIFLFCQAMTDLSLPNLMSDIVDGGLSKSGVTEIAPKEISAQGMQLLSCFMNAGDNKTIMSGYEKFSDSNGEYYKLTAEGTKSEEIGEIYNRSVFAFVLFRQAAEEQSGAGQSGTDQSSDLSAVKENPELMNSMYEVIPSLEIMKSQGMLDEYMNNAKESDSMIQEQMGTAFTQLFYIERGLDVDEIQRNYISSTGLKMIGVALIGIVAAIIVGFFSAKIGAGIGQKLRRDIFEKVESFSNSEFDNFSTASLITRTTNDVQQVQMLITMGIRLMCYAPIMGIGGIIMALNKSTSMSWIIALAVIVLIGLIIVVFSTALPKFKAVQKLTDRLNLVSRENLSGMLVIRAFGNEVYEEKRFDKANRDLTKTNKFIQRVMAFMMPGMTLIMNIVTVSIVWVGAHNIADSTIQLGDMMAFMQYAMQIIMSFLMIAIMFIMVPRASVSITRIKEVLDTELTIKEIESGRSKHVEGDRVKVEFENVFFRYTNAESDVLENINLVANPGETTAFIGSTGSGKSTIINLIPRFYDVTGGSIKFNGVDIRDIPQHELREAIGYVPQKGVLFSGDIESNIKYGKEDAELNEIFKSIEVAQAKDFVDSMENGIETQIAQGGGNVSGGQKQRISIARALVKNPPVYIFDDSFSALDFKTDVALRKALKEYTANATVFIVAQRVSTIMTAEKIVVLNEGRIVGVGTHKELMESCDTYKEIAESQLAKEELA